MHNIVKVLLIQRFDFGSIHLPFNVTVQPTQGFDFELNIIEKAHAFPIKKTRKQF